ncbi:MAG: carboxylate--amine ligase [Acidobacteriia bacterium]|nr:carboxylate--amine ligase [Terriglobia bacterium]
MRSLGRLGVAVFNVDPNPWAPAFFSSYCRGRFLWDIEHRSARESVEYLSRVAEKVGQPAVLIPTTDRTAVFVADHAEALRNWFLFPDQPASLVRGLRSKKEMHALARHAEIPAPETIAPRSKAEVLAFLKTAAFPVMLKAVDGQRLWEKCRKKMFIVRSAEELLERYERLEDPSSPNLLLQEYIPGGDNTVWMFNGYFNEASACVVGFTGKKIRQCPVYAGSTSLGICLWNEQVADLTRRFMKEIGYRGILDIGFRYDARDRLYKVLDVNPRIGATFRLFVGQNGIDVARALYLDLTGQVVPCAPAREGRKWIVEDLDLVSCYRYHHDGKLTLRAADAGEMRRRTRCPRLRALSSEADAMASRQIVQFRHAPSIRQETVESRLFTQTLKHQQGCGRPAERGPALEVSGTPQELALHHWRGAEHGIEFREK